MSGSRCASCCDACSSVLRTTFIAHLVLRTFIAASRASRLALCSCTSSLPASSSVRAASLPSIVTTINSSLQLMDTLIGDYLTKSGHQTLPDSAHIALLSALVSSNTTLALYGDAVGRVGWHPKPSHTTPHTLTRKPLQRVFWSWVCWITRKCSV